MMSMTMIGLTLGLLVHALFLFALMNLLVVLETPLVVSLEWNLAFFLTGIESIGDIVLLVVFVPKGVESKGSQLIEIFWRQNPDFPS